MDFFIKENEPLQPGLRRIEMETLEEVEQYLEARENVNEAIHNARRGFKKLRALARLVQFEVGKKAYRKTNQFYRNEARKISLLRDTTAMIETVERLEAKHPDKLPGHIIPMVKVHLFGLRDHHIEEATPILQLLHEIREQMDTAWKEMLLLCTKKVKIKRLLRGMKKVYGRAYFGYHHCRENVTDHHIHDWRKRAKYLRYQLGILSMAWAPIFQVVETELHQLTDYLGDFHDLEVLKGALERSDLSLDNPAKAKLFGLIELQQFESCQLALESGARLFAEKPKVFIRRMEHYLRATWG